MGNRNDQTASEASAIWYGGLFSNVAMFLRFFVVFFVLVPIILILIVVPIAGFIDAPETKELYPMMKVIGSRWVVDIQNQLPPAISSKFLATLCLWGFLIFGLVVQVLPFFLAYLFFNRRAKQASKKEHIRGTKFVSAKAIRKEIRRRRIKVSLPFGSIVLPQELENRHIFTIGLPGTGKSQMLRKVIKKIRTRKDRCVIFDSKGEFFAEFYDPKKDLLFNPLDKRSLGWNIFNEIRSYPDIEALSASLIPPANSLSEPFWIDAARDVFSSILKYLYQNDQRTNADLWRMLTAGGAQLFEKFKSTKGGEVAARYLAQDKTSSRQADGVLATMMQYTKVFEFMSDNDGDFSISKWLSTSKRGSIFITNYEDIENTLRPILSLFIDLLARRLLVMPDDLKRRIFFLLDEFGSLQRLPSIVNLLTRGRSKGAAVFLGIQDNGQIERIYDGHTLETIENSCGSRVTFALNGKTAEREARLNIGEVETSMFLRSFSTSGSSNFNQRREKEPAYLPSEIAGLPDLTAIVKLRGYDFTISKWKWEASAQRHKRFMIKDGLTLESVNSDLFDLQEETEEKDEIFEVEVPWSIGFD